MVILSSLNSQRCALCAQSVKVIINMFHTPFRSHTQNHLKPLQVIFHFSHCIYLNGTEPNQTAYFHDVLSIAAVSRTTQMIRDWSLIMGRGGYKMGKWCAPPPPPPQDRVKLFASPLLKSGNSSCPPLQYG